jgi:hypothetical protein
LRLRHAVTEIEQHISGAHAHQNIIIDQQHAQTSRLDRLNRLSLHVSNRRALLCARQPQRDLGALAWLASDPHGTTGLRGKPLHHRKTEASALADTLCGEERFLSTCQRRRTHALTGVRYGHADEWVSRQANLLAMVLVVTGNRQGPALRHRVARIYREIDESQFKLVGIDLDRAYFRRNFDVNRDVRADRVTQEVQHFWNQLLQGDELDLQFLSPRKGEKTRR